jgi:beta-lactamase regulating signal transducer with metallopeptidase domain
MNAMQLLTGSLAQAIGWALLHLLWQATIVAGILAATLALVPRRSATARYAIACGALALVFAMFVTTAFRAYDPAAAPIATVSSSQATQSVSVPLAQVPMVIAATAAESWRDRARDFVTTARQSLPSVVALWFLGVVVLSVRLLVSWSRAHALIHRGVREAGAEWHRVAARLSSSLGIRRAVRLLESAAVEVPSVLGALRPIILLPASTLTGLTPEQIEMVLAHELAHIRRHDFAMNLLQAFVETLMFYHPAVWWMSSRVRAERENCCDDLALSVCGNPLQYARTLTRLEELRATAMPMVVAANGGSLIERIRRIAGTRAESTVASSRWAAAVVMLSILAIGLAVPSVPLLAQREPKPVAEAKPARATVDVVEPAEADDVEEPAAVDESESADEMDATIEPNDDPNAEEQAAFHDDVEAHSAAEAMVPFVTMAPPAMPTRVRHPQIAALEAHQLDADDDDLDNDNDDDRSDHKLADSKLTVDELISLRAVGVTPEYVNQMRALFPEITVRQLSGMKAVGVSPEFVQEMRNAGLQVSRANQATSLAAVGVTPEFVREMRAAGFQVKTASAPSSLRAVGVTPAFVREMHDAGIDIDGADEATSLKAVGVTPEYLREMRAAGFEVKSSHDATSLRAVGVTPEYIRDMRAAGVEIKSARDASSLRAVGVTPQFVKKLVDAGYAHLSVRELCSLAASGIDDDFVRDMEQYRQKKN